ncbi:facilitated trehalose transporter Tret1-like [Episyrphus balteatus]|uniref:facilitated trehalose transporter Tret1-like n=1 Tax=Episyrphus balteatus TaxID=286459 RepID=UPI002486BA2D|nr:facilitated trehalose transporter Tret1-like [Episyrphus balteatus]
MENQSQRPSKLRLFLVVIFGNLSSFTLGTCIAWPSPMMPKLRNQSDDSPVSIAIDKNQEGWIFSLISIGAGCSALIAGPLADRIGRKPTMMLGSIMFILAYITMILANRIEVIYLGRILEGMGAGCTMTVVPMYVGEIATKESRGSALSLMMLFMTLGMLYVYCIGPYTRYLVMQVCCLAIPSMSFWGYFLIPESPYYLVKKDRIDSALRSLQTIRGQPLDIVKNELPAIQESIEQSRTMTTGRCADITKNPANRRALIIVLGLMMFQQFSGAVIIIINSQSIFMQANASLGSAVSSIIVGIVQVCSSVTLQIIVDLWKRRTLLRLSAIGMGIAQFTLGTFFFIDTRGGASHIRWLPMLAFILFQLSYRIGFGPLPFTVLGELFPPNIKSVAATSVTITCWGLGFLIARFYPLYNALGSYYVFWTFSIFCVLAFLFAQFIVMETHGLSLNEIQDRLQKLTQ